MAKVCSSCGEENPERARFCLACATDLSEAEAAREKRKLVTVVFSDLTGSTSLGERLDSESLRVIMLRYYEEMRRALEAHGGTVEKFIGDAVMAVFGTPVVREDDALRAVRGALAMAAALDDLNREIEERWGERLLTRTGINSGEVVSGASGDSLATGDAVNVAARLEQAAGPGEILIGETTQRLLREAAKVEAVEPLTLKGKSDPVAAYRLEGLREEGRDHGEGLHASLVGRESELNVLLGAWELAKREERCGLSLIIGEPGVGKSRLCRDFCSSLGGARVLNGRCLPYGRGITYWPVSEIVKSAAAIGDSDPPAQAEAAIAALIPVEDGPVIARGLSAAIGITDQPAQREDIFRAFRLLLETIAEEQPLIVVFDDIQWSDQILRDLISYLARNATGRLLILCLARPELTELTPEFIEEMKEVNSALAIGLEPLGEAESGELINGLLGSSGLAEDIVAQIAGAARGNPLFVEEMLRSMVDEGQLVQADDGSWQASADQLDVEVPATIQALLASRLERLPAPERGAIERASVIGEEFWAGAVCALGADDRVETDRCLTELSARELIHPGGTPFAGDDPYRFGHLLVKEVAYSGLLKQSRAEFHERFAGWLEERAGERSAEFAEIIGYHLETAHRYRTELGYSGPEIDELAHRAGRFLAAAGIRKDEQGEAIEAVALLERAISLLPQADQAYPMFVLGRACAGSGDHRRCLAVHESALEVAARGGDQDVVDILRIHIAWSELMLGHADTSRDMRELAEGALPGFRERSNEAAVLEAQRALASVDEDDGLFGAGTARFEVVLATPRLVATRDVTSYSFFLRWGPVSTGEAIERLQVLGDSQDFSFSPRPWTLMALAGLKSMQGRFDQAREICAEVRAFLTEFGRESDAALLDVFTSSSVEMLAGEHGDAEKLLTRGIDELTAQGMAAHLASALPDLARVKREMGDREGANSLADRARELTATSDLLSRLRWRAIKGTLLADEDRIDEAEALLLEAREISEWSDLLAERAVVEFDLARVLRQGSREPDAQVAGRRALSLFAAKEHLVGVGWVNGFLSGSAESTQKGPE